jgi:hypothetical protein
MKDVRFLASMYSNGMATRTIRIPQQGKRSISPRVADISDALHRLDARLDEALEETFPASDPVSITPAPNAHDGNYR